MGPLIARKFENEGDVDLVSAVPRCAQARSLTVLDSFLGAVHFPPALPRLHSPALGFRKYLVLQISVVPHSSPHPRRAYFDRRATSSSGHPVSSGRGS